MMSGLGYSDCSTRKLANAVWRLFSSPDSVISETAVIDTEALDRAARVGLFRGSRRWQVLLVLLHAVLMVGGLSRVHHLPNGQPSHPHSTDSVFAEMSECEGEVCAEFAFLATTFDQVTPFFEEPSVCLDTAPIVCSKFQARTGLLLRGPPVA